ncbi:PREDICTED: uncharacterized protein LOC108360520 [Rhagoletis zephyria]|uniref:uncharacterized protein LOC108360520 n=1 Tax=Rhagoletis zephyria TaxID=28612 RepID=UPI00081121C7|nr:PREDICTED: uncharacterized protein LOC108360520 [Rhagoletis zephyria]
MQRRRKKKTKKKYSAQWLLKRELEGFSHKLLKEIECEDSILHKNILRMTPAQFAFLLEKVRPYISKQDTKFRNCIGAAERLQLTLRYLSTGETQRSLQLPFRIQQSTIFRILKESVPAIYLALRKEYLKFPASEQDWRDIAKDFYQMWGFPNCIGALDGKHCRILPVRKAGSTYFNYKGYHSFVLMAIADAHYRFIYADVGVNGRVGDAGIWLNLDLIHAIEKNEVHIPAPCTLPFMSTPSPFVLLADDAFALKDYLMKPYSHLRLSPSELKYNNILTGALLKMLWHSCEPFSSFIFTHPSRSSCSHSD